MSSSNVISYKNISIACIWLCKDGISFFSVSFFIFVFHFSFLYLCLVSCCCCCCPLYGCCCGMHARLHFFDLFSHRSSHSYGPNDMSCGILLKDLTFITNLTSSTKQDKCIVPLILPRIYDMVNISAMYSYYDDGS